jgi:hypothetical protein
VTRNDNNNSIAYFSVMHERSNGELKIQNKKVIHTTKNSKQIIMKESCPTTYHGGAWGEKRYSAYSFTTSALDRGELPASHPGGA